MSSTMQGRKLAALLLLAFACDGEFRFDRGPASSAGSSGATPVGPQGGDAGAAASGGVAASGGAAASAGAAATAGAAVNVGGAASAGGPSVGGMNGASGAAGDTDCGLCEMYGLFCSDEAGVCVECLNDLDCSATNPYCDLGMHRCIPCTPSDGCAAGSVCDGWSHSCLQSCATELDPDHDCSRSTHMCNTRRSVCVECLDDDDCSSNPRGPHCAGGARCAECAVDTDCGAPLVCDPLTFTCVVCKDSRDCGAPLVCDPANHTCVGGEYDGEK